MENIGNSVINDTNEKSTISIFGIVIEMTGYLVISIMLILLVRTFLVQHVKVSGTSMEPTLYDKQHLFIEKVSPKIKGIERFDIIVFQPYENNNELFYIKRVIGLPGEEIRIENNTIYINGKKLNENYGSGSYTDAKLAKNTILLDKDDYFVLGDNREVSKDSREKDIGLLNEDCIVGKAWLRIYPFSEVGFIKH